MSDLERPFSEMPRNLGKFGKSLKRKSAFYQGFCGFWCFSCVKNKWGKKTL
jgi:hypothetical protein